MDRTRQKISKGMEDFSNTIVQLDLNDTQLLPQGWSRTSAALKPKLLITSRWHASLSCTQLFKDFKSKT